MGPILQLPGTTPVLALDIDGVLNTNRSTVRLWMPPCRLLDDIIRETRAAVLLTSSWRHLILNGDMSLGGFSFMIQAAGASNALVVGFLPADDGRTRLAHITDWLARYAPQSPYAILDDEPIGGESDRLVQVIPQCGLMLGDVYAAIDLLRTPLPSPIPEHHIPTGTA